MFKIRNNCKQLLNTFKLIDFVEKFDRQKSYAGDVTVRFLSSRVSFHCLDKRHVPLVIILFLSYQFPAITNNSNSMTLVSWPRQWRMSQRKAYLCTRLLLYAISETTLRDKKLGNQSVSEECVPAYSQPTLFTQAEEKPFVEHNFLHDQNW